MKKIYKILCIFILNVLAICLTSCNIDFINEIFEETNKNNSNNNTEEVYSNGIQVHSLELGNKYTGDSTLIVVNGKTILIDAGSRIESANTIVPYIKKYTKNNKLDYVVATHAHQDHIAAFLSNRYTKGIFESFNVSNIIDFGTQTEADSNTYENYCKARNEEIAQGANYYPVQDFFNSKNNNPVFDLGNDTVMTVLETKFSTDRSADGENDYSVCILITYNNANFLFTGDLEKEGEESLVELNPNLPQCVYYKAGHHGSKTSSNDVLLKKIKPEVVCICCCCGSPEYTTIGNNQFPTQEFIDRIAKYTDEIYATSVSEDADYEKDIYGSLNGNIVVSLDKAILDENNKMKIKVVCSNIQAKLKDTEWFKERRVWD